MFFKIKTIWILTLIGSQQIFSRNTYIFVFSLHNKQLGIEPFSMNTSAEVVGAG